MKNFVIFSLMFVRLVVLAQGQIIINPYVYGITHNTNVLTYSTNVVANGGTVDETTLGYLDTFVGGMQTDGTWTKCYEIYTFTGDSDASLFAVRTKLKYVASNILTNSGSVPQGAYITSGTNSGVKFNGTSYYFSTDVRFDSGYSSTNLSLIAYVKGTETNLMSRYICAVNNGGAGIVALGWATSGSIEGGFLCAVAAETTPSSNAKTDGFLGISCFGSRSQQYYTNGIACGSPVTASSSFNSLNLIVGANNVSGTPSNFSTRYVKLIIIGQGFSASEMSAINSRIQTLMSSLGRAYQP